MSDPDAPDLMLTVMEDQLSAALAAAAGLPGARIADVRVRATGPEVAVVVSLDLGSGQSISIFRNAGRDELGDAGFREALAGEIISEAQADPRWPIKGAAGPA